MILMNLMILMILTILISVYHMVIERICQTDPYVLFYRYICVPVYYYGH
jgi:hypothetical protein